MSLFPTSDKWSLTRTDFPYDSFTGQFSPQDYAEEYGTTWTEIAVPRRTEPPIQWSAGSAKKASFKAKLWARDATSDLTTAIEKLKRAIEPDKKLGRPPSFYFEAGSYIHHRVVVESLGGITYGQLARFGQVREVDFSITLRIVEVDDEAALLPLDPSAPPHLSRWHVVAEGETYESMALAEYGSPLFGIFLRQDAEQAFPLPGDRVRMPAASYYTRRRRTPQAYCLGDTDEPKAARQQAWDARSGSVELPGA